MWARLRPRSARPSSAKAGHHPWAWAETFIDFGFGEVSRARWAGPLCPSLWILVDGSIFLSLQDTMSNDDCLPVTVTNIESFVSQSIKS